jgi:hypothetical protein
MDCHLLATLIRRDYTPTARSEKSGVLLPCACTDMYCSVRVLVCCVLQHLDLELSEGFELWLDAGDELSELRNLRSLTISGVGHTQ